MVRSTKKGNTSDILVSQSYLGAKTLALQEKPDYLELLSRRPEKPKMVVVLGSSRKRRSPELEEEVHDVELDATTSRGTRDNNPNSLIRVADDVTPHGSSARQRTPENTATDENIPTAPEIEEFFTHNEQSEQCLFIKKYNFDVVNDVPLPGRYEWVKVLP